MWGSMAAVSGVKGGSEGGKTDWHLEWQVALYAQGSIWIQYHRDPEPLGPELVIGQWVYYLILFHLVPFWEK